MFKPGENGNHPRLGSKTKTDPIRRREDVKSIKALLRGHGQLRNLALFTLGANSALRPVDLREIRVGQVRNLKPGDSFPVRESKTGKYRRVMLNNETHAMIQEWLNSRPDLEDEDYLFASQKGEGALTVPAINNLVKSWCAAINLFGNFGGSSLRKTFGYHQRVYYGLSTAILMVIFNHTSERQTLDYLGMEPSGADRRSKVSGIKPFEVRRR